MELITLAELRQMAEQAQNNGLARVVSHWTAGHHDQFFQDYDVQISGDGSIWVPNRILEDVEAHVWRRNSDSIGVAICGAYKGNTRDLGPEAPTEEQLQTLPLVLAAICQGLGWPVDPDHVMTHQEIATIDGYGPGSGDPETRWDLWFLRNGEAPGSGGDQIRAMTQAALTSMEGGI